MFGFSLLLSWPPAPERETFRLSVGAGHFILALPFYFFQLGMDGDDQKTDP